MSGAQRLRIVVDRATIYAHPGWEGVRHRGWSEEGDHSKVRRGMERLKGERGIVIGREFEGNGDFIMISWWESLGLVQKFQKN